MRLKLIILTFSTFFILLSSPLSRANDKDFSNFNVREIFIEDEGDQNSMEDDISVTDNLITQAQENENIDSPIMAFILRIINILSLLVGTFAFIMILIGGFIFTMSGGDEAKVDKGKAIIAQSIVGLVFAFMSYTIVLFVQSFLYN